MDFYNKYDIDYSEPWCSHVRRNDLTGKYFVSYNKGGEEGPVVPARGLWVDDFPDGTVEGYSCSERAYPQPYMRDFVECFYDGYETFSEYMENYYFSDNNYWRYVNDITFSGVEYFLYESSFATGSGEQHYYGLMPKIYTISYLKSMSVYEDNSVRMHPFDYILSSDMDVSYEFDRNITEMYSKFVLVKVDDETDSNV